MKKHTHLYQYAQVVRFYGRWLEKGNYKWEGRCIKCGHIIIQ